MKTNLQVFGTILSLVLSITKIGYGQFIDNTSSQFISINNPASLNGTGYQLDNANDGGNLTKQSFQIKFQLGARDLIPRDELTDPYAELFGTTISGRTETLCDTRNPDWPDIFTVIYYPGATQAVQLRIRNAEITDGDNVIGYANFNLSDIAEDCNEYYRDIKDGSYSRGILVIKTICDSTPSTTTGMTSPTTPTAACPSTTKAPTTTTARTTTIFTTRRTTSTRTTTESVSICTKCGGIYNKTILCILVGLLGFIM